MFNILLIAYEFPPLNRGGVYRPLFFAKYLNEYDIKPFIVTLSTKDYPKIYSQYNTDESLQTHLKDKNLEIIEISSKNLLKRNRNRLKNFLRIYFNFTKGSEYKYWRENFFDKTRDVIRQNNIKAILVTAPPFGVLLQAVKLSSTYKLPLIIDMRDAWSYWITSPYPSKWHFKKTLKLEEYIFEKADKIIVTSKQTISDFIKLHPKINPNKFEYIPNGYDENINFKPIEIDYRQKDKLNITYVGSFYYSPEARKNMLSPKNEKKWHKKLQYTPRKEDWLYRSPYFFLKTINKLITAKPEYKEKIKINFVGKTPDWLVEMIKNFQLENIVKLWGFVDKQKALEFERQADFLLITSSKVINGKDYSIAGKTFEYFSLQKPILAFVTESAQKDILKQSGLAVFCEPDNTTSSVNTLINFIENKQILYPNSEFLKNLHRKKLTEKLASIIKSQTKNL